MVLKGDAEEEVFQSRSYQTELEEIATSKNTLIHLPTGSGKTHIAIRLIERYRQDLQKPWGEGGKRTFFLVNTVPLAKQQQKMIKQRCPVEGVGAYTGEDAVDYWNKSKWDEELSANQVVVMTSQILNDMLTHGYINIQDINLLIFDECHHAVDDHPMRVIMKKFESCPPSKQPRVLGLTATLLNGNVNINKVKETLQDLETTFHSTIATVNDLGEVLTYSTNPIEMIQYYAPPVTTKAGIETIKLLHELMNLIISVRLPTVKSSYSVNLNPSQKDITVDPKKTVKAIKNMISSMILHLNEMGVYGGSMAILSYIILLERLKRKSTSKEEETLYKFAITHCVEARMILLESMANEKGYDKIIKHSSERIILLINILKEYNPMIMQDPNAKLKVNVNRKPLSAIIFTRQRFTSKILYNILKEVKESNPVEFGFLKHDFVVGFNVNPFNNTREDYYVKKVSQQLLLKFANKDLNCLISTSVIEEGVDIPQCLLVIRYDLPLEYRSYIQSKGRARSQDASYVMLVSTENKEKFQAQFNNFQKIEQHIYALLVGKTEERIAPTAEDIQSTYEEDDIPPYITENGNHLSAANAISLLNRYCSILPKDQFTTITANWILENVLDKKVISIVMPITCPIKDPIMGKPFEVLKTAKRSAAMNACIKLHQIGELDPITLLPKQYARVDFEQPCIKDCFLNWPWDEVEDQNLPKAGTKTYIRKHKKEFPLCLKGRRNWSGGQRFYFHVIKLKPAFPRPEKSREGALYDLLLKDEGFGFLTQEPMPKLCSFPMFLTIGEVITTIEINQAVVSLEHNLFNIVKNFHYFIFDQVLDVQKKFLVFDGTMNALYVVPITFNDGYDIDWTTMHKYKDVKPTDVPSVEERISLQVRPDEYKYAVVSPWHRGGIHNERYIVSNVLEYMTPQSHFSEACPTFEVYYEQKYNVTIMGNKKQPLLEVRNISSRMNCLMARAATINAFSDKQKKLISYAIGDDKPKGFDEIFVPEFCVKQDFPGVLWYKAMMLPSIVHRVTNLLVAEELRMTIAHETKYGCVVLPKDESWLPIQVDLSIAIKSMLAQVEDPLPFIDSIDRINNPIDQFAKKAPNIVSMKETVYQLQKKKISKDYPWDEKSEPLDIERNLTTATVMDIECYDTFVTTALIDKSAGNVVKSPQRQSTSAPALLPPLRYNKKIHLLSKKPEGRGPEQREILAALTTINSHDSFDLERAETLGDAFLKFAASLYLFHKFPTLNEGQLTNIKCRMIGNRNLYYAGASVNLGGRMKLEQFSPRQDFLVPGFFAPDSIVEIIEKRKLRPSFLIGMSFPREDALSGKLSKKSKREVEQRLKDYEDVIEIEPGHSVQSSMQCYIRAQAVADKSIADCVEALIGTYLLNGGTLGAIKIIEWMKILPPQDKFAQYLNKRVDTVITQKKATAAEVVHIMNGNQVDVERIINYKFKDPSFLLEALSHPSYIRNRYTNSYERLEFLGDALLDFLITSHLFENCNDLKPGDLTDLRSALVNNVTFASYVVKLGLHKYLCTQLNPVLENAIINFVEHQEQRDHEIIEDVLYLIDEEECQLAEYIDVPKVLSDIFESIVGAIYLDTGGNLETVWDVVYRIMHKEIAHFSMKIPKQPVRVLYEAIHACPSFGDPVTTKKEPPKVILPVTISKEGRQHTIYGVGSNKSQAKRAAAKLALKVLGL